MLQTQDPLEQDHFVPWDLHLNELGKGLLAHATHQISSQVVLKKKMLEYFSMSFYGSNPGLPGAGPFSTWGPPFEQTWYRTIRQCCILNFKPLSLAVLEKKIFEYILFLNLRPPAAGPVWTLGLPFEQTWFGSIRQCFIPNIKDLGLLVSDKSIFEGFPYVEQVCPRV